MWLVNAMPRTVRKTVTDEVTQKYGIVLHAGSGEQISEELTMGKVHRSARTGEFVSEATAARHPKTTVTQTVPGDGHGNRSAITGRFVTDATAARHPNTTIRERR